MHKSMYLHILHIYALPTLLMTAKLFSCDRATLARAAPLGLVAPAGSGDGDRVGLRLGLVTPLQCHAG